MHQKIAIACFFACLSFSCLKAQVKTNFNSAIKITADGKYKKNYKLKIHDVPVPDLQKALAKDNADANNLGAKPFIIAEPVATNIDVVYLASWTNDNETAFGRFILKAPKAKSLSINFNKFYLPEGTEMFIYNEDGTMITGPVTSAENNEKQIWGSSIYKGDVLNIELRLNLKLKPNLILNISNVAYGFKDIFIEKTSGFGQSGPCNINVLCPLGTGWENERNSVVYITREDGSSLCSGAMLNNTLWSEHPLYPDCKSLLLSTWSSSSRCIEMANSFSSLECNMYPKSK
jgi:lysyl endopeptidase